MIKIEITDEELSNHQIIFMLDELIFNWGYPEKYISLSINGKEVEFKIDRSDGKTEIKLIGWEE